MFDQLTNWTQCTCSYRNFEHREGCIVSRQSFTVPSHNFSHTNSVDCKEVYEV